MRPVDFPALLARVQAGGLEAIADDMGPTPESQEAFVEQFTSAELADLLEAHLWTVFPFLGDDTHWLAGRVRARRQAERCQRAGRCEMGPMRPPPCSVCKRVWGRAALH
jgi:hypothetical protein